MTKLVEGDLDGSGLRIGIVVAKFNEFVTGKLLEGALAGLHENGVASQDVLVATAPLTLLTKHTVRPQRR